MNHLYKDIKENWIILVFIVGLVVAWTTFGNRLDAVEVKAQENKSALQQLEIIKDNILRLCIAGNVKCVE